MVVVYSDVGYIEYLFIITEKERSLECERNAKHFPYLVEISRKGSKITNSVFENYSY